MRSPLKYTIARELVEDQAEALDLDNNYVLAYKDRIEKQLSSFTKQIIEDDAEIELTVGRNGKEILYWKIIKWTPEGYDKLITSNVI